MPRSCVAPGCTEGYGSTKSTLSFFSTPKDAVKRDRWQRAIPRINFELKAGQILCEKHFLPQDIVRKKIFKDAHGKIIAEANLRLPRLADDAVPTLFPDCSAYISKPKRKSRQSIIRTGFTEVAYKRKRLRDGAVPCFFPEGVSRFSRKKRKARTNNDIPNKKEDANKEIDYSDYPMVELSYSVKMEPIESEVEENNAEVLKRKALFDKIWSNTEAVDLPSRSWAAYLMNQNERRILLFTQMAFLNNGVPVPAKQVCFDSEMNVELYLKNTKLNFEEMNIMPPKMISNQDVSSFIKSVDGLIEWE